MTMTNNPTIDGVSRELLTDLLKIASRNTKSAWSGGICEKARALLDAPVVERQPAADSVALMVTEWVETGIEMNTDWRNGLSGIIQKRLERLHAAPPVAVVLPDRKPNINRSFEGTDAEWYGNIAWNACLDATAALNGGQK
jgi:hypothetical protein